MSLTQVHRLLYFLWFMLSGFTLLYSTNTYAKNIIILKAKKRQVPVYKKPDFDSEVIYILKKEKKFYGTLETLEGLNGLGLFHKVRINAKTYGYVLDTDILPIDSKNRKKSRLKKYSDKSSKDKDSSRSFFSDHKPFDENESYNKPFLHRSYIGGFVGATNYTLEVESASRKSLEWVLGFKISGPQLIIPNFLMDITLSTHWG